MSACSYENFANNFHSTHAVAVVIFHYRNDLFLFKIKYISDIFQE